MKKTALVTGITGGVGSAEAKLLMNMGYLVVSPVRDLAAAHKIFGDDNRIRINECDLENEEHVEHYLRSLKEGGITPDLVVFTAGAFMWDQKHPGFGNTEEGRKAVSLKLWTANFLTKRTVAEGLMQVYQESIGDMTLAPVLSQAADFASDDERRIGKAVGGKYTEHEYCDSMHKADVYFQELSQEHKKFKFGKIIIDKPGWIHTDMAEREFTMETIGFNPDWEKIQKPDEYAREHLVNKVGIRPVSVSSAA